MNKLLVICGPTATGKTSLGIKLAKKLNGEIISADSRQVYRGMDIGTGKDLPENPKFEILNHKWFDRLTIPSKVEGQITNYKLQITNQRLGYYVVDGVKIWLYDVIEPDQRFSAGEYAKLAWLVIEDIWKRNKLPILVGGTGFYIKAVVDEIETINIPPDWKLRAKLRYYDITILRNLLKELDPERLSSMNQSDGNNPRRLIRAIEIALQIRNPKFEILNKFEIRNSKFEIENTLFIGLTAQNKVLYEWIDWRVEEREKQGVIEEIKGLLAKGYHWENSALGTTIGYKEWRSYFQIPQIQNTKYKIQDTKKKIVQRWKYAEHAYARRQITWFQRDKRIRWFDITKKRWQDKVDKLVEKAFHF